MSQTNEDFGDRTAYKRKELQEKKRWLEQEKANLMAEIVVEEKKFETSRPLWNRMHQMINASYQSFQHPAPNFIQMEAPQPPNPFNQPIMPMVSGSLPPIGALNPFDQRYGSEE